MAGLSAIAMLAFTCADDVAPRETSSRLPSPSAVWEVLRDPQWLYEIEHPRTWKVGPLLVSHGDTRQWEMLALATYRLRSGGDRCPHIPVNALNDLGPRDALLYVQEPEYVEGLPSRHGSSHVGFSTEADYLYETSIFRCVDEAQDFRYAFVPFGERGRNFFALLALGLEAPSSTRRDLLRSFDSLRILDAEEYRAGTD